MRFSKSNNFNLFTSEVPIVKSNNGQRGNLALIVGTAILLVIIGVGFLFFTLFLGGGRETQNAVDAGALNAAKVSLIRPGVAIDQLSANERQFLGVANKATSKNPEFALGNINRVWGQALLVAINLRAMQLERTELNNANEHVRLVFDGAKTINNKLTDRLDPKGAGLDPDLQDAFVGVANANSVRMLNVGRRKGATGGSSAVSVSPSGNKAGYADTSNASNVNLEQNTLDGILANWAGLARPDEFRTTVFEPIANKRKNVNGKNFLKGYENIEVGTGFSAYFVPLQPGAKPRMLSQADVSFSPPNLQATKQPVPNAFLSRGRAPSQKTGDLLDFAAIALAEPLDMVHPVAIPNGFIKIKNWPGLKWQKSGVNAALKRAVTIRNDGRNDGRIQERGLHAVEYANHQLLLARADFDPDNNAPAFGGSDPLVENMENPYMVLMTGPSSPIINAENHLVFCMESELVELTQKPRPADNPMRDDPLPPNNTCGGLIQPNCPLPPNISCKDLTGTIGGAKSIVTDTRALYNGQIDFNQDPPALMGAAAGDPILQRLARELGLAHGNNDTVFGSKNHPHIWSVYPPKDGPDTTAILDIGKAGPGAEDPTDARLMYSGVLLMPDTRGGRVSRAANGTRDNPILFGQPITLSEALEPSGGPAALLAIRQRIIQRCKEIDPAFTGDLRAFDGVRIDMGQDAYIYKAEGSEPGKLSIIVTPANETDTLPPRLKELVDTISVDGKPKAGSTIAYDCYGNVTEDNKTMTAPGLVNVAGDWGYELPYENDDQPSGAEMARLLMWNKFVFRPCTGFNGLLGVLEMKSFISNGNPGCEDIGNKTVTSGGTFDANTETYVAKEYSGKSMAIPEDCPCVSFKKGTYPASGAMQTGATPGPWPGMNACGGPTPDDLPNCSHTGAC